MCNKFYCLSVTNLTKIEHFFPPFTGDLANIYKYFYLVNIILIKCIFLTFVGHLCSQ